MSTGPGHVERSIRNLIEQSRGKHRGRAFALALIDLTQAVYGVSFGATKAQKVSALRAMHRIVAREPGWIVEHDFSYRNVTFYWSPPTRR